jgi:hypothetical protein
VFLIRPTLANINRVIGHTKLTLNKKHFIIYVPSEMPFCKYLLKEAGIWGNFTVFNVDWNFTVLDDDLFSMEINSVFREVFFIIVII